MEFAVMGWPEDEPRLRLDYRQFSYAGKFVTGSYGIAVVRDDKSQRSPVDSLPALPDGVEPSEFADEIIAAVAFNADRTNPQCLWLRYLTVRQDFCGSGVGLGPRLAACITERAAEHGYTTARIAVNNVFSYQALYKAGFSYTGRRTGIAELVLERPTDAPAAASRATYRQGLDEFRDHEGLSAAEQSYLDAHEGADPPALIEPPALIDPPSTPAETDDSGVSNPRRSSE